MRRGHFRLCRAQSTQVLSASSEYLLDPMCSVEQVDKWIFRLLFDFSLEFEGSEKRKFKKIIGGAVHACVKDSGTCTKTGNLKRACVACVSVRVSVVNVEAGVTMLQEKRSTNFTSQYFQVVTFNGLVSCASLFSVLPAAESPFSTSHLHVCPTPGLVITLY